MSVLLSIKDRITSKAISKVELLQREAFLSFLKNADLKSAHAMSVSCGDGVWDYLALRSRCGVSSIDATDIVDCPVAPQDEISLKKMGDWHFQKINADCALPFSDNSFDVVWHQDVLEHTEKPYLFISEQFRVLRSKGTLIVGTPNLLRPTNLIKLGVGRLVFPVSIGFNNKIGEYIHVQEFHERQLQLLLEEVGFVDIMIKHIYFGLLPFRVKVSDYPNSNLGKTLCHFMMAKAIKP